MSTPIASAFAAAAPATLGLGPRIAYGASAFGENLAINSINQLAFAVFNLGSPTKVSLTTNWDSCSKYFDIALAVRPEFESDDFKSDPDQVKNVAVNASSAMDIRNLTDRMMHEWRDTGDPCVTRGGSAFDQEPFVDPDFVPPPRKKKLLTF